jgi:hypothetical protein
MSTTTEETTSVETQTDSASQFFDNSPKMVETVINETKEVEKPEVTETKDQETEKPVDKEETKTEEKKTEEIVLKAPEGSDLSQAEIDEVLNLAKENNLTQEQAQKIVDARASSISGYVSRTMDKHKEQIKAWGESIKADKELGGENYSKTVELAKRAIDKYASPALKKALDDSGYGNHPELVRVFKRFGETISDSKMVHGSKSQATAKFAHEVFYGEDKK